MEQGKAPALPPTLVNPLQRGALLAVLLPALAVGLPFGLAVFPVHAYRCAALRALPVCALGPDYTLSQCQLCLNSAGTGWLPGTCGRAARRARSGRPLSAAVGRCGTASAAWCAQETLQLAWWHLVLCAASAWRLTTLHTGTHTLHAAPLHAAPTPCCGAPSLLQSKACVTLGDASLGVQRGRPDLEAALRRAAEEAGPGGVVGVYAGGERGGRAAGVPLWLRGSAAIEQRCGV